MQLADHIEDEIVPKKDFSAHYDVSDPNDPFSVINMAPPSLRAAIRSIPPEIMKMDELILRRRVKPEPILEKLRLNFAEEYARAIIGRRVLNMQNVTRNVTYREHYEQILSDPLKVCWMVRPPADMQMTQKYLLHLVFDTLEMWTQMEPIREITITEKECVTHVREFDPRAVTGMKRLAWWLAKSRNGGIPYPLDPDVIESPMRRLRHRKIVKNQRPALRDMMDAPTAETSLIIQQPPIEEIIGDGSGFDDPPVDEGKETDGAEGAEALPDIPVEADVSEVDELGGLEPGDFADLDDAEDPLEKDDPETDTVEVDTDGEG